MGPGTFISAALRGAFSVPRGRPIYALFQVTARCNLACRMCSVWEEGARTPDLSPEAMGRVAENLAKAGVLLVNLAGEPLLRNDLPRIVAAFSRRGIQVRMQTNATLALRHRVRVAEAIRAGLTGVSVSLDTLVPGKQAWICRTEGVWEEIVEGVATCAELLPGGGAAVQLNCVVSGVNLEELPDLVRFAQEAGVWIAFSPIHVSGPGREDPQFARTLPPEFQLGPADALRIDDVFRRVMRMRARGAPVANSREFLERTRRFLAEGPTPIPCHAGTRYLFIDHTGGVAPCHDLPADLRADSPDFVRTLSSRAWRRRARAARAACPGCLLPCWIELSALLRRPYTGLGLTARRLAARRRSGTDAGVRVRIAAAPHRERPWNGGSS